MQFAASAASAAASEVLIGLRWLAAAPTGTAGPFREQLPPLTVRSHVMISAHRPFSPAHSPFPYAWIIVVAGAAGILLSAPGQTIGVSVFTDDLIAALRLSRFDLSIAYLIGTTGSALLITRMGRWIDRWGARGMAAGACFALGVALLYNSQLGSLAERLRLGAGSVGRFSPASIVLFACMTVGFFLIRFTGQGVLTLASRTMVMRWFIRYRGRVMGLVGICLGLVFSASPMVFEVLIKRFGWDGAWLVMGIALMCVFAPLVLLVFRDNPEECGLKPDALGFAPKVELEEAERDWTLQEARRTYTFWIFNLALALFGLVVTGWTFHVVSIFAEAGLSRSQAVAVFFPSSVLGLGATLIAGWLLDSRALRDRLHLFLMLQLCALCGLGLGMLLLEQRVGFWVVVVCQGLANSLFGLLSSVVWPRYFGRKHLGAVSGLNMAWLVFASAIGPLIFAASQRWAGSYRAAIVACMAAAAILTLLALRAVRPEPPLS